MMRKLLELNEARADYQARLNAPQLSDEDVCNIKADYFKILTQALKEAVLAMTNRNFGCPDGYSIKERILDEKYLDDILGRISEVVPGYSERFKASDGTKIYRVLVSKKAYEKIDAIQSWTTDVAFTDLRSSKELTDDENYQFLETTVDGGFSFDVDKCLSQFKELKRDETGEIIYRMLENAESPKIRKMKLSKYLKKI